MVSDRSFAPEAVHGTEDGPLQITVARVGAPRGSAAVVALRSGPGRAPASGGTAWPGARQRGSAPLRDCLAGLVDAGVSLVVVDLSAAGLLDAAWVGVLAGTALRLRKRGGRLVVVRPDDGPMARVMRMTGLDAVLPAVERPRDALALAPA